MLKISSHRVLYYHHAGDMAPDYSPTYITPSRFERQIRLLSKLWRFCSLDDAFDGACASPTFSICTDDGFASNFSVIRPILNKYKIPFTMFLISKCVDNRALAFNHVFAIIRNRIPHHRLVQMMPRIQEEFGIRREAGLWGSLFGVEQSRKDELADFLWKRLMPFSQEEYLDKHKPFLSSEQIRQLIDEGHHIGSHSHSHPDFSRISPSEQVSEIQISISELSRFASIRFFAFPYGRGIPADQISGLCHATGLSACFGTRFTDQDNYPGARLWQRQKMEQTPREVCLELFVKPYLRR